MKTLPKSLIAPFIVLTTTMRTFSVMAAPEGALKNPYVHTEAAQSSLHEDTIHFVNRNKDRLPASELNIMHSLAFTIQAQVDRINETDPHTGGPSQGLIALFSEQNNAVFCLAKEERLTKRNAQSRYRDVLNAVLYPSGKIKPYYAVMPNASGMANRATEATANCVKYQ